MSLKLLTEQCLEFLSLKGGCTDYRLHLSKYHIVGNHVSRLSSFIMIKNVKLNFHLLTGERSNTNNTTYRYRRSQRCRRVRVSSLQC